MALVLSGSIDISGSMTATTILISSPGAAGMVSSSAQITELAPLMAYTASLKGAAIVSSSQQITNYYKFAETASANTFYGTQTFVNTETTFNYNPQTSLLAGYNYLNFGGGSIMYRNTTDIYIGSNAKYGPAGTLIANYTSANGMGLLTMDGGALGYQSSTGSVSAGVAYPVPSRWNITAKGMMGLGYTSPQDFTNASGYGQFVIGPTDGNGNVTGMTIYSTLTNGIMFADATSGPGAYAGYLVYTHASDKLEIATSSTPRLTLDSNGSTFSTSNVTITNGNLVMGTSGKGIDFSATANSSGTMTSELLNDYEEGTWTPTISDGTNNATMTATYNRGQYIKVGRQVTVTGYVLTDSLGSVSGDIRITGLPYTNGSGYGYISAMVAGAGAALNITAGYNITGVVSTGQTYIGLNIWDSAVGTTALQASEFSSDGQLQIACTYLTDY